MGLNFALLNFILASDLHSTEKKTALKFLEVGKLKNSMTKKEIEHLSKIYSIPESILKSGPPVIYEYLGCDDLFSLDNSGFEGATLIKNLNLPPIKSEELHTGIYDIVIDGGTTEHIYNPIVAIANYLNYLKVGGTLFQFLPTNNYIDHGLYQFSPTFFWSIKGQGIQLRNLHFIERSERNKYYWDGLSIKFKMHVDKSYDGSGLANLFRFRNKNIVALAQWEKTDSVDFNDLIQNSNQEIYSLKWANDSMDNTSVKRNLFESLVVYVYKSRSFISKFLIANLLLVLERQRYKHDLKSPTK
jgi:hypothetical protein